jgi:hypothetical protein
MFNVTTILTFYITQRCFNLEDMGGKQADMTKNWLLSLQLDLQIQEMNPTMKFIFWCRIPSAWDISLCNRLLVSGSNTGHICVPPWTSLQWPSYWSAKTPDRWYFQRLLYWRTRNLCFKKCPAQPSTKRHELNILQKSQKMERKFSILLALAPNVVREKDSLSFMSRLSRAWVKSLVLVHF